MPSHLTRNVFRLLLANQPIVSRNCAQRPYGPRIPSTNGLRKLNAFQRRTIWGFASKAPRGMGEPSQVPGLVKMQEYTHLASLKARPPPARELQEALLRFFAYKAFYREVAEDIHMQHALNTFRYLCSRGDSRPWRNSSELGQIWAVLRLSPKEKGGAHLEFTRFLYSKLEPGAEQSRSLVPFIASLCKFGATSEAQHLLEDAIKNDPISVQRKDSDQISLWKRVLKGFAREGNETEILKTISKMQELPGVSIHQTSGALVEFFAERGDMQQARRWYDHAYKGQESSSSQLSKLLELCAKYDSIEWGHELVRALLEKDPEKAAWDAVFVFSAASGKGVDEIERMMKVMVRRSQEQGKEECKPDINTINDLVAFSMSRKDPYMAERYIALGKKWGITPNARSYILQMEYRLSVADIDGARAAYAGLQSEGVTDSEDLPVINQLIQAMCKSGRYDFDSIMNIVDELTERRARFEPDTISVLCELHLKRDELNDVIDLLRSHAFHYGAGGRSAVRDIFATFCLNRQTSTARAWDVYMILHELFPETPRVMRTDIMNSFFQRGRADMACHLFSHMRESDQAEVRANRETYIAAFTGIAANMDEEALIIVHNQMKLDFEVEPDTRLYNALMLAYTECGMPRRALEFWDDIVASKEGPSYNSIILAFRACERNPFGDQHAKAIWDMLVRMDLDVDREVFAAYVAALAGNQVLGKAEKLIQTAEDKFGFKVDALILGSYFNAAFGARKKEQAEAWIRQMYPAIWEELEQLGTHADKDTGTVVFNINRSVDP